MAKVKCVKIIEYSQYWLIVYCQYKVYCKYITQSALNVIHTIFKMFSQANGISCFQFQVFLLCLRKAKNNWLLKILLKTAGWSKSETDRKQEKGCQRYKIFV